MAVSQQVSNPVSVHTKSFPPFLPLSLRSLQHYYCLLTSNTLVYCRYANTTGVAISKHSGIVEELGKNIPYLSHMKKARTTVVEAVR